MSLWVDHDYPLYKLIEAGAEHDDEDSKHGLHTRAWINVETGVIVIVAPSAGWKHLTADKPAEYQMWLIPPGPAAIRVSLKGDGLTFVNEEWDDAYYSAVEAAETLLGISSR